MNREHPVIYGNAAKRFQSLAEHAEHTDQTAAQLRRRVVHLVSFDPRSVRCLSGPTVLSHGPRFRGEPSSLVPPAGASPQGP
jgi:hypothetical protein